MDRQAILEGTVRGLAAQGWAKAMDGQQCVYGYPGGNRCAIGVHLGEKTLRSRAGINAIFAEVEFDVDPDGDTEEARTEDAQILTDLFGVKGVDDVTFLNELQRVHDMTPPSTEGPVVLRAGFVEFAQNNNLVFPEGF